jgi:chromosome segregation ATPase
MSDNRNNFDARREARMKHSELEAELKDMRAQLEELKKANARADDEKADPKKPVSKAADGLESAIEQLKRQQHRTTSAIDKASNLTERREARTKQREIESELKDKESQLEALKRGGSDGALTTGGGKPKEPKAGLFGGLFKKGSNKKGDDAKKEDPKAAANKVDKTKEMLELEVNVARLERNTKRAQDSIAKAKDFDERREARSKHRELEMELKDMQAQLEKLTLSGGGITDVKMTGSKAGAKNAPSESESESETESEESESEDKKAAKRFEPKKVDAPAKTDGKPKSGGLFGFFKKLSAKKGDAGKKANVKTAVAGKSGAKKAGAKRGKVESESEEESKSESDSEESTSVSARADASKRRAGANSRALDPLPKRKLGLFGFNTRADKSKAI